MANKKVSAYKAGLFIVVTIFLLLYSLLWLRYFAVRPDMTVLAKFENPGPVPKGLPVYFHGVNVGKVIKVDHSDDLVKTFVFINIYKKTKIPNNSIAEVKMEGVAGQKFIDLVSPGKPSRRCLKDKDIIEGKTMFGFSMLESFLQEKQESGEIDEMFENLETSLKQSNKVMSNLVEITDNVNKLLKGNKVELSKIIKDGAQSATNIKSASAEINKIVTDKKFSNDLKSSTSNINKVTSDLNKIVGDLEFQKGLKNTVTGVGRIVKKTDRILNEDAPSSELQRETITTLSDFSRLLNSTNRLVTNWDCYSYNLYSDIEKSHLINNMSYAFAQAGLTLDEAKCILNQMEKNGMDKSMKDLIISTLRNTNNAAKSVNHLSTGTCDMLSKRFLMFRLLFGRPGASLDSCKQGGCKCD